MFFGTGPTAGCRRRWVTDSERWWPADALAGLAGEAGFIEVGRKLREPREEERYRRGRLLMRKGKQPR